MRHLCVRVERTEYQPLKIVTEFTRDLRGLSGADSALDRGMLEQSVGGFRLFDLFDGYLKAGYACNHILLYGEIFRCKARPDKKHGVI